MNILFNLERDTQNAKAHSAPVIGEIVLIHEESLKHSQWRLGRIHEVVDNSDGQIRCVILKVNCNG